MQGEHRVARSRIVIIASLTLVGAIVAAQDPDNSRYLQAIPINLACLAAAVVILYATRRGNRMPALALATSVGDVTLVSLLHVAELAQGGASVAVNGRVTFIAYFFALLATCVRVDRRLPFIAGGAAAVQYLGIALWSWSIWPDTPTRDVLEYGAFDWGTQFERIVLLLLFASGCAAIARWAIVLRTYATRDPLTGLINRRTFEERLHNELLDARRRNEPLSVVMLDVDHFKRVNDSHGHHAGDVALATIGAILLESVRRTDLAGRWGGEEFALALPASGDSTAAAQVERLRSSLEGRRIQLPGGHATRLTISAGVATAPIDGWDPVALVRSADQRLLAAKALGRNQIVSRAKSA
jgi:diguanylate cyclase (GGDEF)-like protein